MFSSDTVVRGIDCHNLILLNYFTVENHTSNLGICWKGFKCLHFWQLLLVTRRKMSNGERKFPAVFLAYSALIKYDISCCSPFCITESPDGPLKQKLTKKWADNEIVTEHWAKVNLWNQEHTEGRNSSLNI